MSPEGWQNLALAGLLLFYALYAAWQVGAHMMCSQIGVDYCEYLSAGQAANAHGYGGVYDLQILENIQRTILPTTPNSPPVAVLPFLYLPIFVLPFQLLSQLQPEAGYWIWTAANIVGLWAYLQFFARRLKLDPIPIRLMAMMVACLPVFMNLLTGQMELSLLICTGEFMRAFLGRKPLRAGLWLGGFLLKPQVLLLIGAALLLQRSWKILYGLAISSSVFGLVSLLLVGPAGMAQMVKLWLGTAGGQANVWEEGMMNWRMLGTHLSHVTNPWIGWGMAILGMVATVGITLYVWRRPLDPELPSFPIALLGILAATAMVAWHAHIHMAVFLIPPLVTLYQAKVLPHRVMNHWFFLPASMFVVMTFVPEMLATWGVFPGDIRPWVYFFIGAAEFSVNLYLFWWAVDASRHAHSFFRESGLPLKSIQPEG